MTGIPYLKCMRGKRPKCNQEEKDTLSYRRCSCASTARPSWTLQPACALSQHLNLKNKVTRRRGAYLIYPPVNMSFEFSSSVFRSQPCPWNMCLWKSISTQPSSPVNFEKLVAACLLLLPPVQRVFETTLPL